MVTNDDSTIRFGRFTKEFRVGFAPEGQLGGVLGEHGINDITVIELPKCQSCYYNIDIKSGRFLGCHFCARVVHAKSPCATLINGVTVCSACANSVFPADMIDYLFLMTSYLDGKKSELRKFLGFDRKTMRGREEGLTSKGFLDDNELTLYGKGAVVYLWNVYQFNELVREYVRMLVEANVERE